MNGKRSRIAIGKGITIALSVAALLLSLCIAAGCTVVRPSEGALDCPVVTVQNTLVQWDAVDGADEYVVEYMSNDAETAWQRYVTRATQWNVAACGAGSWQVRVQAVTAHGGREDSPWSTAVIVPVVVTVTAEELNMKVYRTEDDTLWLVCSPVAGVDWFDVYMQTAAENKQTVYMAEAGRPTVHELAWNAADDGTVIAHIPTENYRYQAVLPSPYKAADAVRLQTGTYDKAQGDWTWQGTCDKVTVNRIPVAVQYQNGHTVVAAADMDNVIGDRAMIECWQGEQTVAAFWLQVTDTRPMAWEDKTATYALHDGGQAGLALHVYTNSVTEIRVQGQAVAATEYAATQENGIYRLQWKAGFWDHYAAGTYTIEVCGQAADGTPTAIGYAMTVTERALEPIVYEYRFVEKDVELQVRTHGDTVTAVRYKGIALPVSAWHSEANVLTITADWLGLVRQDRVELLVVSRLRAEGVTVVINCAQEGVVMATDAVTYDKATGQDLTLSCAVYDYATLWGGGIVEDDYVVRLGTDGIVIGGDYLQTLAAGRYDYVAHSVIDSYWSLTVIDSRAIPERVRLNHDIVNGRAYVSFDCDCGGDQHTYSLDNGDFFYTNGQTLLSVVPDRAVAHTLVVQCGTNHTRREVYIEAVPADAWSYMDSYFEWQGRQIDRYIDSEAELAEVVQYLAYAGEYDSTVGSYGQSKLKVYVSAHCLAGLPDLSESLNAACDRFDPLYNYRINVTYQRNEYEFCVDFASPVVGNGDSGMVASASPDTRDLLPESGDRTIDELYGYRATSSQTVYTVKQLATLPTGVKPVFADNAAGALAKEAYEAAVGVCLRYIRRDMTDREKVTVFYRYLTMQVTYDKIAVMWYDLYNRSRQYTLADMRTYMQTLSVQYEDNAAVQTALYRMLACTTADELQRGLLDQVRGLPVFDAYGALCRHVAVCDGIAEAMNILCALEGIPCIKVSGLGNTATGSENHAWNKVRIDGYWYVVDATWGRLGDYVTHAYLLVPDTAVVDDHWENYIGGQAHSVDILAAGDAKYYQNTIVADHDLYMETQAECRMAVQAMERAGERVIEFKVGFSITDKESFVRQLGLTGACRYMVVGDCWLLVLQ